MVKINQY